MSLRRGLVSDLDRRPCQEIVDGTATDAAPKAYSIIKSHPIINAKISPSVA